jgi:hypothetical protein
LDYQQHHFNFAAMVCPPAVPKIMMSSAR